MKKTGLIICALLIAFFSTSAAMALSVPDNWNSIDGRPDSKKSPLYKAIMHDSVQEARAAIDAGADVNEVDSHHIDTMLLLAIRDNRLEIAKLLISSPGIDVNKRGLQINGVSGDAWERTPLILSAMMGYTEIVDLLLKKNAEITATDRLNGKSLGNTALHQAARRNHLDTVRRLMANPKKPDVIMRNARGVTPFWFSVENENIEMVKLLFSAGSKVNIQDIEGSSILSLTILHNKYDVLDFLILKGADLNAGCPLMAAVGSKNVNKGKSQKVVEKWIEKFLTFKPDVNAVIADSSALHLAASLNFVDAIKLLLDNGARTDLVSSVSGHTPLHTATIAKSVDAVKYLIKRGAKTELLDKAGYTPLMSAVILTDLKMAQTLVEGGAVIDVKNPVNIMMTPLVFAAGNVNPTKQRDYIKMLEFFLDNKAGIDFQALNGNTALIAASEISNHALSLNTAEVLIGRGAKLDIANTAGETALMLAAGTGNEKLVKLLVDRGADIHKKSGAGETVMSFAARSGKKSIVSFLESKGAKIDAPDTRKKVTVAELIGTWRGFQDGMPQAVMTLVLKRDNTFDFNSRLTPEVLGQFPRGTMNPVIAVQKGTYTLNNDILVLNITGAKPVSRKWKIENKMLVLDSIIRMKKIN